MALGPRDTTSLVMLTGWDATALQNEKLADGTTFAAVVAEMNAALGGLNASLYNDPLYAGLVSYSDNPAVSYRMGASNGMQEFTEYGRADAARAVTDGHMLPLKSWDRGLGWTWNYLRFARMADIQADIADAIKDVKDRYRLNVLTRLLQRGDDSGEAKGLGSSGLSPGFATAAASTGVDFTPPANAGTAFTSDHEHYVGIGGGLFTSAVFSDAKAELREHGHEPPYQAIIGPSDEATVIGLSDFVPVANNLVAYGQQTALAQLANTADMNGSYYIGTLSDTAVRVVRGIPQYYGFVWKSYGPNSQRNPLRLRLQKNMTRPMVVAMTDPRSGAGAAYPLQYLMLFTEFGVGVMDRTNGTARYVNNATWADGDSNLEGGAMNNQNMAHPGGAVDCRRNERGSHSAVMGADGHPAL